MTKQPLRSVPVLGAGLVILCVALAGCTTTRQTRGAPETTGFLGDYSQLRKGTGDEAQLVYIDPNAAFSRYDAIWLESVTLWDDSETSKLSAQDRQMLTDHLYQALATELGKDYRIVDRPGPGVMRLRAAMTKAEGSRVVMDTITSIIPQARLLSSLAALPADTRVWVGEAGIEAELLDSMTGTRLAAAVDERAGTKAVRGGIGKWSDVKLACDYWAERFRTRLAELRAPAMGS